MDTPLTTPTILTTITTHFLHLVHKYDSLSLMRCITLSALFWALLLIPSAIFSRAFSKSYQSLSPSMRGEWLSRIVSDIHAVILMPLLYYALFMDNSLHLTKGLVWNHKWIVQVVLKLALGYFLYDLLLVLVLFKSISGPVATVCHHALVVGVVSCVFVLDYPLLYMWAAGLLFTELSTPFVNQRWFMAIRHRHSTSYKITGLTMTLAFFVARPLFIPLYMLWLLSKTYLMENVEKEKVRVGLIVGGIATGILYALNCYWFGLMWRGLKKALRAQRNGGNWDSVEEVVGDAHGRRVNGDMGRVNWNRVNGSGVNGVQSGGVSSGIGSVSSVGRRRRVEN